MPQNAADTYPAAFPLKLFILRPRMATSAIQALGSFAGFLSPYLAPRLAPLVDCAYVQAAFGSVSTAFTFFFIFGVLVGLVLAFIIYVSASTCGRPPRFGAMGGRRSMASEVSDPAVFEGGVFGGAGAGSPRRSDGLALVRFDPGSGRIPALPSRPALGRAGELQEGRDTRLDSRPGPWGPSAETGMWRRLGSIAD